MTNKFIDLLYSQQVLPTTREVLLQRLVKRPDYQPQVILAPLYSVLQAVLGRLIPQDDRAEPIDIASRLDEHHFLGHGGGWRYADMPPQPEALKLGLESLEQDADRSYSKAFTQLTPDQQDHLLGEAQRGNMHWSTVDSKRWFEGILSDATSIFASHPETLDEIGFSGIHFGWEKVGLNEGETWEPEAH